ncbi:hypothetical protein ABIB99_004980 [Bradyrhizobium sp. LA6.1]|uniref:hypothetical protein n=1 Tax=Bradyrhizobium sp. LA6.1 TaxID=3156378 RepID=UPI00339586F3
MRTARRQRQNTLRRQEQEYRDKISKPELSGPESRNGDTNTISVLTLQQHPIPAPLPILEAEIVKPPRQRKNIQLIILAYSLGFVGIGINGWFAYSRGSSDIDKLLLCGLGFIAESIMFYLPAQTANLWRERNWGGFIFGSVVCVLLFAFAVINGLGFATLNLHEITTARAERVTPAVSDAQRRLDIVSTSRASECIRRGDKCRQLEKDEQQVIQNLMEAREKVSATADPQVTSAAKLVSWVTASRFSPTADDFAMLRLLLLTTLPQLGGLILMLASRSPNP